MKLEGLATGLFHAGERVCCAVSGGADSVALLLALTEANAARESLGAVLTAVHVHHGLRGEEADGDEAFVRQLCERLGVALTVQRVDTGARQAAEREGLEEAARNLRYEAFWGLLEAGLADSVATAHTMDDQAETVVMKQLRGAWTEGLGGISPVVGRDGQPEGAEAAGSRSSSALSARGGAPGRVVRPMLGVRRDEVERYLRERGQGWREDSSNQDTSLTRNRVRHELMPTLRSFNPGLTALLARTAEVARDEEAYWQTEVRRVLPGLLLPGKPVRGGGRAVSTAVGERSLAMEVERLRSQPPALARRLVRAAAAELGCRIGSEETAKLLALTGIGDFPGLKGRNGAKLELSGGLRAERSVRELRLFRVGR